jgi:RNA recognition motif-containing protein
VLAARVHDESYLLNVPSFAKVGRVHSVKLCRDAASRRVLGHAYIAYDTTFEPDAARNAIIELDGFVLHGKAIKVRPACKQHDALALKANNLVVKARVLAMHLLGSTCGNTFA